MLIKRREKKIVVEAFTTTGELIDLFPIERTENVLPNWYQELPGKPVGGLNVKQCPGAKDLFSKGLIIPLWADYEITLAAGGGGDVKSAMRGMNFPPSNSHSLEFQATGAWPNYDSIKFNSPWWMWCSEPIEWAWVPATWWQQDPQEIIPVPGIAEYRYQHITNINTLVKKSKTDKVIFLKAGTPMVQLIPLTERDWEFKLEVLTQEEIAKKFTKWEFSLNPRLTYQKIRNILERKNKVTI